MQDVLGISVLSYSIFISCSCEFFVLNLIKSVLEKFRNSKLVLRTSCTQFKNNRGSGLDIITLVSSAKRIGEEILFNTKGKSLI
jgi:hypothetical protein